MVANVTGTLLQSYHTDLFYTTSEACIQIVSGWEPSKNDLARSSKKRSFFLAFLQDPVRSSKILWDLVGFCKTLAGILLQDSCKEKINPALLSYCYINACFDSSNSQTACKFLLA